MHMKLSVCTAWRAQYKYGSGTTHASAGLQYVILHGHKKVTHTKQMVLESIKDPLRSALSLKSLLLTRAKQVFQRRNEGRAKSNSIRVPFAPHRAATHAWLQAASVSAQKLHFISTRGQVGGSVWLCLRKMFLPAGKSLG